MTDDSQGGINKRQFLRKQLQIEVSLYSESNFYKGFSENISEGGLFIATYDLQPVGAIIEVEFKFPYDNETIKVKGEVRWLREYNPINPDMIPGMGLKFVNLSDNDKNKIDQFINKREPLFYDDESL